jgi:hypothetical protein
MQTLGLQTVLTMSNVGERVQQSAQTHGAVVADQFKSILEKQNDEKSSEVQAMENSASDVQIKPDTPRHPQRRKEDKERRAKARAQEAPAEGEEEVVAFAEHGHLLDIKI